MGVDSFLQLVRLMAVKEASTDLSLGETGWPGFGPFHSVPDLVERGLFLAESVEG